MGPRSGERMVLHGRSPRLWSPIIDSKERLTFGGAPSILQLLYSQLIVLAAGDETDPHRAAMTGNLARSWEIPDGRSLVFQIRDDVRWPSNELGSGRSLAPSDVRYMHEMYRDERVAQYGAYRTVDRIEADDAAATVSFSLSEPTSFRRSQGGRAGSRDHAAQMDAGCRGRFGSPGAATCGNRAVPVAIMGRTDGNLDAGPE